MNNIQTAGFNLTKGVGITCRLQIVLRKTIIYLKNNIKVDIPNHLKFQVKVPTTDSHFA